MWDAVGWAGTLSWGPEGRGATGREGYRSTNRMFENVMSAEGTIKLNNEKQVSVCVYCSFPNLAHIILTNMDFRLSGRSSLWLLWTAGWVSDLLTPLMCLPMTQEQ